MDTYIVKPCGYCLGVNNAIDLSLKVKKKYPSKNVYIFGDIHGCYEPLDTFFKTYPFSESNAYIFIENVNLVNR